MDNISDSEKGRLDMSEEYIKMAKIAMQNQEAIKELLDGHSEIRRERAKRPKKRLNIQSPEKVMAFACVVLAAVVGFYLFSWTMWRETPENILEYSKWLFGVCTAFFMAVKGYQYGCDKKM